MWVKIASLFFLLSILFTGMGHAHFGVLVPSRSMVISKNEAKVTVDVAFAHPFAASGMKMDKPLEVFMQKDEKKTPLELVPASFFGEQAFRTDISIERPGVYFLGMVPQPYYEPSEDSFIIHYTKTVIGAFGYEDDYDKSLGLPVEILPLTRPFGNYAGNSFSGMALYKGKPLANAAVEVEFLNSSREYKAPNSYFETQVLHTDANGVFTFTVPWAGWWGFAALTSAEERMNHNGEMKDVELGGVLWLQFYPLPAKE